MKTSSVKKINNAVIIAAIAFIYWLLVTGIYCIISFTTGAWSLTWITWPIAAGAFLISGLIYFGIKRWRLLGKHPFIIIIVGTILIFTAIYLAVSFIVGTIWAMSWLIFIAMLIAIFIEIMIYFIRRNQRIDDATETESTDSK